MSNQNDPFGRASQSATGFHPLQVDMLSEINIAPRILTNFTGVMPSQFKKDLDSYLKTRSPVTFLSELRSNLQVEIKAP